jgi:hypothetical protein
MRNCAEMSEGFIRFIFVVGEFFGMGMLIFVRALVEWIGRRKER